MPLRPAELTLLRGQPYLLPCHLAFLIVSSAPSYLHVLLPVPESTYLSILTYISDYFILIFLNRQRRQEILLVWSQMYQ